MAQSPNFHSALSRVLSRELSGFVTLQSAHQLTAGASQETYKLSVETEDGEAHYALRRSPSASQQGSDVGSISLETEARLFQLAGKAGIPGPDVICVLRSEDDLGSGFIMQWLDGETLGQRIVKAEELAEVRPRLAGQCGEYLARIHSIDWQAAGLEALLPNTGVEELVDKTWAQYAELNVPEPMIDYAWRWLKENLPENSRTCLVHGDFRNGNLMVDDTGINAVLDWELAEIGNPIRDLGWLCVNSWRFGRHDLPVGGFGHQEDLLAAYRDASGCDVDEAELIYWQVFGSFWWAVSTLVMTMSWRNGETPSLERPVIGRRSSEAQMDCVNLLIPGEFSLPNDKQPLAVGTQLPMPAELLSGVAEFLKNDVATALTGRDRFLAKVAANSLGIAQRELMHGNTLAESERHRLIELLDLKDEMDAGLDELRWQLVNRLRADMDLINPLLSVHLRQTVAGQLAIDQPRYTALSAQVSG